MTRIVHEDLSRKIIGAAMEVLNELKPGLDEKLYERAIVIALKRGGHHIVVQRPFPVFFRGELIGSLVPDLIVDDVATGSRTSGCRTRDSRRGRRGSKFSSAFFRDA